MRRALLTMAIIAGSAIAQQAEADTPLLRQCRVTDVVLNARNARMPATPASKAPLAREGRSTNRSTPVARTAMASWKMDRGVLAEWTATVRDGGVPQFAQNLTY